MEAPLLHQQPHISRCGIPGSVQIPAASDREVVATTPFLSGTCPIRGRVIDWAENGLDAYPVGTLYNKVEVTSTRHSPDDLLVLLCLDGYRGKKQCPQFRTRCGTLYLWESLYY